MGPMTEKSRGPQQNLGAYAPGAPGKVKPCLQFLYEFMVNFKVIFKIIIGADDTCQDLPAWTG